MLKECIIELFECDNGEISLFYIKFLKAMNYFTQVFPLTLKFILCTMLLHIWSIGFGQSQKQYALHHSLDVTQNSLTDLSINLFSKLANTSTVACQETVEDIDMGGGYPNPIIENTYNAEISITATGIVSSGTHVNFKAGNMISLNPGFAVESFSEFSASIVDCEPIMEPCEFDVDAESSVSQFYNDSPVEISYNYMDNSTILNSVTIYCFERECFTSNNIGDVYSVTITPPEGVDMYSFTESFTVIEPGLYSCIIYTHEGCPEQDEFYEMFDFEIWYSQGIHPCE